VTTTYPGVVKAWHKHKKQSDNMACVAGTVKVVLRDARKGSPTFERSMNSSWGSTTPFSFNIPAGVWHGWKCVGPEESVVVNAPTEMYDPKKPDEQRLDPHKGGIPYDWSGRTANRQTSGQVSTFDI